MSILQENNIKPYMRYSRTIEKGRPIFNFHIQEKNINNPPILIGQVFGQLTTLEKVEQTKWICKCNCGAEIKVEESLLLNNIISACEPCSYIGKKYNKLTILEDLNKNQWLCKCTCDNTLIVDKEALLNEEITQCSTCQEKEDKKNTQENTPESNENQADENQTNENN